jgi:hypothetical protein
MMIVTIDYDLTDDEYQRANERPLAKLRSMCPGVPDADLTRVLRQATGCGGAAGNARLIEAALLLHNS